jgi:hypothetical protein
MIKKIYNGVATK